MRQVYVEGPQLPGGMGAGYARLSRMGGSWHGRRKPCGSQGGTVLVPWLVTSIVGEGLTAFTFCRSRTGHPCSYFPLGPNPQGLRGVRGTAEHVGGGSPILSRQQVPPSGSPELDRRELAFAPVCQHLVPRRSPFVVGAAQPLPSVCLQSDGGGRSPAVESLCSDTPVPAFQIL